VSERERAELATWVPPGLVEVFGAMHPADQRHGLDVVAALRAAGHGHDRELLLAGLVHDAGKGRDVRLWHRVAWSLGRRYGGGVTALAGLVPGARAVLTRLDRHAALSAELARRAGAPDRLVALIGGTTDPDDGAARALRLADEGRLR
jgi:hypothetical protein